jgi:hypothetical protein
VIDDVDTLRRSLVTATSAAVSWSLAHRAVSQAAEAFLVQPFSPRCREQLRAALRKHPVSDIVFATERPMTIEEIAALDAAKPAGGAG